MRRRNERRMAELRKKSVGIVWIHNENSQAQSSRAITNEERRNDKAIHSKTKTCLEICSPRSCDDDVWNTGRTVPNIYNFKRVADNNVVLPREERLSWLIFSYNASGIFN
ncbi:hypothetical protein RB195_011809 [Necator americanus]|uniref:Uncharacterized protein n=1 Tax=Necator americanus TaxID=51031 RepID=A0ABR1D5E8_NECAM